MLYLISAFYGPLCLFIASTDQLRNQFTVAVNLLKDSVYWTGRNHFKEVLPRRIQHIYVRSHSIGLQ